MAGNRKQRRSNPQQKRPKKAARGPKGPAASKVPPTRLRRSRARGAARPVDLFDPRSGVLVPTLVSEGSAFPISGSIMHNLLTSVGSNDRALAIMTNTGRAGTVLATVAAGAGVATSVHTIPLLSASDIAGGPTSARPMKGGLTMINRTQVLNMGGQVSVLNSTQRVKLPASPSTMTATQWKDFFDTINGHPRTRIYNGADFAKSKTYVCHPLDQVDYTRYGEFHGTFNLDDYFAHFAIWPGQNPEERAMSTIFVVFEPSPAVNSYEFKVRASYYTRWPLDTVPGQAQRPVPTASAAVINQHRDYAEATAHVPRGEEVGLAAAAGTAGFLAGIGRAATAARAAAAPALEMAELAAPLLAAF